MYETSRKARATRQRSKIVQAVRDMDTAGLFSSVEDALDALREKVVRAEARFEVLAEQWASDDTTETAQFEQEMRREKARETVAEIRRLTQRYESELDDIIAKLDGVKTLGIHNDNRKTAREENSDER